MKQLLFFLFALTSTFFISCSFSSLSNLGNNSGEVALFHYSPGIRVQENGQDLPLIKTFAAHKKAGYIAAQSYSGANGSDLYTNGVKLDKNAAKHILTLIKNDKSVTVQMDKKSSPYIDVTGALGESKTMSLDELRKEYIRDSKKRK